MVVYLIGFMGSGKSTVGKKLSKRLGFAFIDLDKEIERTEGRSVSKIFTEEGESYFRNIEAEVLRDCSKKSDTVISCGGGTPCFNENMEYMNNAGQTVYLEMTAAALMSRLIYSRSKRPLIAELDDSELDQFIRKSLAEREKWYRKSMHIMEGLDPDINQLSSSLLQSPDPYNPR
mgnify:CR=1 FL=1